MTRSDNNVTIYEVGPRDGLQNEPGEIVTDTKLELIKRLAACGLKKIEATSFVSPKWVPQMADHTAVMQALDHDGPVRYAALVPNMKGLESALATGVREIAVFAAASESFSRKNINCSIDESIERFAPVFEAAHNQDIHVRGYVSCIAGCPYEGEIAPEAVAKVAATLFRQGCYEISLGDTIGVGTPHKINTVLDHVTANVPVENIALHCHDTYGQALANIYAGLQKGVRTFDTSVSGLGGCPYAKGASGNVASEDVVYMMDGMGFETGVDLDKLIDTSWFIAKALGREPDSKLAYARKPE